MLGKNEAEIKISTIIGKGSELGGDFHVEGSARIDGKVDGDVTVTGTLIVGAEGAISGNISAQVAMIGGDVLGDVNAAQKVELTDTAKVLGDISTAVIVIDEHAIFQGKCNMNQDVPDRKAKSRTSKAVKQGRKSAKEAIEEALKEVREEESKEAETPSAEAMAAE